MGGELIVGVEKEVGTFTDEHGVTHKRYIKVIDFGALPNTTTKLVAHNITNLSGWLSISAVAFSSAYTAIPIPYMGTNPTQVYGTATEVGVITQSDLSSYSRAYVTLEYYK